MLQIKTIFLSSLRVLYMGFFLAGKDYSTENSYIDDDSCANLVYYIHVQESPTTINRRKKIGFGTLNFEIALIKIGHRRLCIVFKGRVNTYCINFEESHQYLDCFYKYQKNNLLPVSDMLYLIIR